MQETILITLLSASGFWSLILFLVKARQKNKEAPIEEISKKLDEIDKKLEHTTELALSSARDRVNYLCKRYERRGYIPADENIAFRCLGKVYCEMGNTEVKERFEYCVKNLEVKNEP